MKAGGQRKSIMKPSARMSVKGKTQAAPSPARALSPPGASKPPSTKPTIDIKDLYDVVSSITKQNSKSKNPRRATVLDVERRDSSVMR